MNISGPDPICNRTVILANGAVSDVESPNYPGNYHEDLHCRWIVLAQEGYVIQVSVNRGHLGTRDDVSVGIGTDPTEFCAFYSRLPAHVIFEYDIIIPYQ